MEILKCGGLFRKEQSLHRKKLLISKRKKWKIIKIYPTNKSYMMAAILLGDMNKGEQGG